MIYAIRAVGTEYVKFGMARSPAQRLDELQVGCPLELEILATAMWGDVEELRIHRYLKSAGKHIRGEWFMLCAETYAIIDAMHDMRGKRHWTEVVPRKQSTHRRLGRAIDYAQPAGNPEDSHREAARAAPTLQPDQGAA